MKRFECASIHLFKECNMNCSFCYRTKEYGFEKPLQFWKDLIPYFKELEIPQVAAGGGEPLMRPDWIKELARTCKDNGLYFNFTTNGKLIQKVPLDTFNDVSMVSISFDSEKIKDMRDYYDFCDNVNYLKMKFPNLKIGVNYLCDELGLQTLVRNVNDFFSNKEDSYRYFKIDRVFALCPKNFKTNILKYSIKYILLTEKYPAFMVDDLTKSIIESGKYKNWKHPCHFGKIISIDEVGNVGGCSFDLGKIDILKLGVAKDILFLKDITFKERFSCPYLME